MPQDDDTANKCPDCQVSPGELHVFGCDTEQCPVCGGQALQCLDVHICPHCEFDHWTDCDGATFDPSERLAWSGEWPGEMECREFGWYVRGAQFGRGLPCAPDHPDASPDLNRLHKDAAWSRDVRRFVLPPSVA